MQGAVSAKASCVLEQSPANVCTVGSQQDGQFFGEILREKSWEIVQYILVDNDAARNEFVQMLRERRLAGTRCAPGRILC